MFYDNKIDLQQKDIFIARISNTGKIHIYDCLFRPEKHQVLYESIIEYLKKIVSNRMNKVHQNASSINLEQNKYFKMLVYKLLLAILSQDSCRLYVTRKDSLIQPDSLKSAIRKCVNTYQLEYQISFFESYLSNYKTLRGVLLEYLNYYNPKEKADSKERVKHVNNMYRREQEDLPPEILKKPEFEILEQEYYLLNKILRDPFQNKELEDYYAIGGLETIFNYMDTNEIYNSSKEDLLRCGILSKEEYLKLTRKK